MLTEAMIFARYLKEVNASERLAQRGRPEMTDRLTIRQQGTQLLEIYALEIQMYTARKNNKELKKLYEASLQIKSAIAHPLIMGVIRECGGTTLFDAISRLLCDFQYFNNFMLYSFAFPLSQSPGKMHLREGEYNFAHTDFFEAFKNYDESGSVRRTTCLKYLVLASMLMQKV